MQPDDKMLARYARWGVAPPEHIPHGINDDSPIEDKMKQLLPKSWRLEGNELIGMTDMGELRQTIPTDRILMGADDKGLPIFKKVEL